jgi:hypothetical protein
MPEIPGTYSETGFLRQRRNLIVGSVVLLFVQVSELRLAPQGSVFGLPFNIGRPDAFQWFLWVAVLYWALRFYQYHQYRRPTELQSAAREAMYPLFLPLALAHITPSPSKEFFQPPQVKDGESVELIPHNFRLSEWERLRIEATIVPAWMIRRADGQKQIAPITNSELRVVFTGNPMWRVRTVAYLKAALTTPAFTEYILPYIIFTLPILFAGYRLMK